MVVRSVLRYPRVPGSIPNSTEDLICSITRGTLEGKTFSHWLAVVVCIEICRFKCHPRHLIMVQNDEVSSKNKSRVASKSYIYQTKQRIALYIMSKFINIIEFLIESIADGGRQEKQSWGHSKGTRGLVLK
ncbi:hypothetical protein AVEN_121780-1 [Araneus ventricosus]|uniref:Uncharacterized protein n=1 Tax=Araneus ventricosus TaxID=182803 RepID=A0A4Y2IA62_ARAVE|nr:hypothetical protein AVEN_121780-1 [Araneus ventricosus]